MTELQAFLAPLDEARFRSEYFGRRPVHVQADGSRPALFDWASFNQALGVTPYWTEDSLKVFFKSRAAMRESYCDAAAPGQRAAVNPGKLKALIAIGASVVANGVQRVRPDVAETAQMLERAFAARVVANVYCSFQGVQAFQTHFDLHDVFAYQAEGRKTWRVYETRADAPTAPVPPGPEAEKWLVQSRGRLLFEADMKPGDVLYLPRGQYHDALTGAQASLHVTFGVSPATGLAVFKLLETVLAADAGFRAYLPDARDGDAVRARLAALAERVKAAMTSPAFALDVLNHQRSLGAASPGYDLPAQTAPVWFVVARPGRVVRRDTGFSAVHEGGEIALGSAYPLAEWMLQQARFSRHEALARQPGLPEADAQDLLERLTAAGVLAQTEMVS